VSGLWLDGHIFNESEMARSSECRDRSAQKVLDTADIVREAIYPWPGNIRELENVVANGCMMVDTKFIDINDLPERLRTGFTGDSVIDEGLLSLDEVQRRHVMRVLERVGGNKSRAAEILGLGRATIYQFLSRMKLEDKKDVSV